VSHASRYSLTERVRRALAIADVTTSVTDTTSAMITASRSSVVRYMTFLSGSAVRFSYSLL
jgi:hypothetical protein